MSEFETDTMKTSSLDKKTVDASRRKLTAAILAGPVVLGTLASKQALGGTIPYHCTISGQISESESARPGESIPCNSLGASPAFWQDRTDCWGISKVTPFRDIFGSGPEATFINVLKCNAGSALDKAAVASYLNALNFHLHDPAYPLSTYQVVELFKTQPPGVNLQSYFESLYIPSNATSSPAGFTCLLDASPYQCQT